MTAAQQAEQHQVQDILLSTHDFANFGEQPLAGFHQSLGQLQVGNRNHCIGNSRFIHGVVFR